MKSKLLGAIACMALLGSTVASNASPYVVTLEEVGSNVVATGSGAIDINGLTSLGTGSGLSPGLFSVLGIISTGATNSSFALYTARRSTGPTGFGPGGFTTASSGTGDVAGFGLSESLDSVVVPALYVSDAPLSDTAIYDASTFASLGVTPGTYVWTWGSGADQRFTLDIVATPIPATFPLFAGGLGLIGLFGRRRKRKNTAAIAA